MELSAEGKFYGGAGTRRRKIHFGGTLIIRKSPRLSGDLPVELLETQNPAILFGLIGKN